MNVCEREVAIHEDVERGGGVGVLPLYIVHGLVVLPRLCIHLLSQTADHHKSIPIFKRLETQVCRNLPAPLYKKADTACERTNQPKCAP